MTNKQLKNKIKKSFEEKTPDILDGIKKDVENETQIKAPLTKIGLRKLVDRCERLSKSNIKVQKILLETAIINNWKNVYLPREEELQAVSNELRDDFRSLLGLE